MSNQVLNPLPRKSPEELGVSPLKISDFLSEMQSRSIELHSFMLLRHGCVAAEGWWAPYEPQLPHMLFSLSKSFTSTAIGIAVQEGKLSVEDTVISFFPDDLPEEVSPNLAAMRIKHLLMMGTGHAADTTDELHSSADGNWVRAFLKLPVEHEPGTFFMYNTGATYMLSAILQKAAGETLLQYLEPRLFKPLGIMNPTWESCPRGINTGGYGLKITTEDIARFGQLYLQKGMWQGERLLSPAWIEEATSKQIENGAGGDSDWAHGYGYQFWRCQHGVYRGDGAFGQFCIVLEDLDAVIAITAGTNDLQGVLNGVWSHLLGAFGMAGEPEPVAAEATSEELRHQLKSLRLDPPRIAPKPELNTGHGTPCYRLEENEFGIKQLQITFGDHVAVLDITNEQGEHRIELGEQELKPGNTSLFGVHERIAASFIRESPEKLVLTLRRIETPFFITIDIRSLEREVELQLKINVSFDNRVPEPIKGTIIA